MPFPQTLRILVFAAGLLAVARAASAQPAPTPLVMIGEGSHNPLGINALGSIVGWRSTVGLFGPLRAIRWDGGIPIDFGMCADCYSTAYDINDSGEVVGQGLTSTGVTRGYLLSGGNFYVLAPPPGDDHTGAFAISNSGTVMGFSSGPSGSRFVRWIGGGPPEVLNIVGTAPGGRVFDINDAGQVVGNVTVNSATRAFVWQDGNLTLLPSAPGGACAPTSNANRINATGQIVGWTTVDCNQRKPVTWVNGVMHYLPVLNEVSAFGQATGINASGDVVGTLTGAGVKSQAVIWTHGEVRALGSIFGPDTASTAIDINDSGLAIGINQADAQSATVPVLYVTAPPNAAPTVTVPGDLAASATSTAGAVVSFSVSGDDAEDGTLTASCSSASGSVFPIGTTVVNCGVTDSGGLEASASFTVTIAGAAAQLATLASEVVGAGPGKSLQNKIASALASVQSGNSGGACSTLHAFLNEVAAQAGKKLTAAQAAAFTATANRIRAVIGC